MGARAGASVRSAIVATLGVWAHAGDAGAQRVVEVTGDAVCTGCTIRLERVVTLGVHDGPGALSSGARSLARDSRGRYYLVDYEDADAILVFGPDGAFRERLGRAGQGPGEFRGAMCALVGAGDTLHVYDRQSRETIFDAAGALVRTRAFPFMPDRCLGHPSGARVFNGVNRVPEGRWDPIAVAGAGADGPFTAMFGGETGPALRRVRPSDPDERLRVFGPDGRGGLWVARHSAYALERRRLDGQVLDTLERDAPWFRLHMGRHIPSPASAPPVTLVALHADGPDRVWVLTWVPGARWDEALGPERERRGIRYHIPEDVDAYQDTRVELLDVARGAALLSFDTEENLLGFLDARTVYSARHDVLGIPYVDVWRMVVDGVR